MTDDRPADPTTPSGSPDDLPLATPRDDTSRPSVLDAWARLDQADRLLAGGSIATAVVTILGIPFGAWDSADFILIVLVAAAVVGVAVWLGRPSNVGSVSAPLPLIELVASSVAAVLAVWNAIETAFDLDGTARGGIVGMILTAALAIAGIAVLAGALRRVDDARSVLVTSDLWTRLAEVGLVLVLAGWALNLSIGYWTMAAATLTLAVLTLAAVIIVVSSRIPSPIPAAWAGVALGIFAAWLAIGLWSELATLGEGTVDLSITDILSFLIYVVGLGLIVAGGVLTALEQGAKQPTVTAEPPTTIG